MRKTYIFGFKNNVSEKIVRSLELKNSKKFYLQGIDSIRIFVNIITKQKPDFVLGFGEFSKSSKYFLLEKYCSNKFKGKIYGTKFEKMKIPGILNEDKTKKLKLSDTIGNSYCNLTSYLISKTIYDNNLKTKFNFIHVTKNINLGD